MHSIYDEYEDFDFAGSAAVRRILREQMREEQRLAGRRQHGPGDEYDEDDDYGDYDDYDEDEFDNYQEDDRYDD